MENPSNLSHGRIINDRPRLGVEAGEGMNAPALRSSRSTTQRAFALPLAYHGPADFPPTPGDFIMHKHHLIVAAVLPLCFACRAPTAGGGGRSSAVAMAAPQALARPKLIVQITIDQLRGDLPFRYHDRFGAGGFRYLMDQGSWYTAASHPHAHTETTVGHTTLATGSYPSRHGMIGDSWYDQNAGKVQDSFVDVTTTIIGMDRNGSSPRRILTTTFSDELSLATAGQAKVFAVSYKDRGAIPMAGHNGKAFWFSTKTGEFVSSTYYYDSYPDWVTAWNQERHADRYVGTTWELTNPRETYLFSAQDNTYSPGTTPEEMMAALDGFGFGRTFPHTYGATAGEPYFNNLTIAPAMDRLTLDFALALVDKEQLGADAITDYLAISFSATDLVGHWFGPSSLESEDNLLQLDRVLAGLFSAIDERVGLDNTLIVLAGDHGMTEFPEYLQTFGVNTGRLPTGLIKDTAQAALNARFGSADGFIKAYQHPYFYLDQALIESRKLLVAEVEFVITRALAKLDGVALAISITGLRGGVEVSDPEMLDQIRRNQHLARSGSVYVVQAPQWQVEDVPASGEGGASVRLLEHGTPWAYDAHVPVVFAGAQVPARRIARPIYTTDVAMTLANRLSIRPPSGAVGEPLVEVLGTRASAP
jgi:predicted AlkP superfamily pyrophosphatase or phosphodiesterase